MPGATLRVYADLLPASDGTAPFAIHTFNQITGGNTIYPRQAAIANDHFVFTGKRRRRQADRRSAAQFARVPRHREAVLRDARRRHLPLLFSRAGAGAAGPVHSRRRLAQPRLRRLRRGRHGRRIDDARVRLVDRLHLLHAGAGSAASTFSGTLQPWVSGKDIVLELLRRWGAKQSQGMSVELVDADRQLPIAYPQHHRQHDGGGRGAERHLRAGRDHLRVVSRRRASTSCRIRQFALRRRRALRDRRGAVDLGDVAPMIAKPFSPGNAFPAEEVARERIDVRQGDDRLVHQRQLRRSAAGRAGASWRARDKGLTKVAEGARRLPGIGRRRSRRSSGPIRASAANRSPTCSAASAARSAQSWCGPCFGQGPDALEQGPARDHVVQSQLAEPHGPRRRGLSRIAVGRRRLGARRLHGAAHRARAGVGSRQVRRVITYEPRNHGSTENLFKNAVLAIAGNLHLKDWLRVSVPPWPVRGHVS